MKDCRKPEREVESDSVLLIWAKVIQLTRGGDGIETQGLWTLGWWPALQAMAPGLDINMHQQ